MDQISKMHTELLKNFPHMEEIIKFSGTQKDYYSKIQASFFFKGREKELSRLHDALMLHIKALFKLSEYQVIELSKDLKNSYPISSAEHQGSITNPEILNIILNQKMSQKKRAPLLSFACSTVKIENELKSRFVYLKNEKIPLLSSSVENSMILSAPAFDVKLAFAKVQKSPELATLKLKDRSEFLDWFEALCIGLDEVDAFWQQMTIMNSSLWKHFEKTSNFSIFSDYLMLPIELIVAELICSDLENGAQHWLIDCLRNPVQAKSLEASLDGVRSCWNTSSQKGTFLFWYAAPKGKPERLVLNGNVLKSTYTTFEIKLECESILQAVRLGQLIPAGSLSLLYLVFFIGLDMFGGILQVN